MRRPPAVRDGRPGPRRGRPRRGGRGWRGSGRRRGRSRIHRRSGPGQAAARSLRAPPSLRRTRLPRKSRGRSDPASSVYVRSSARRSIPPSPLRMITTGSGYSTGLRTRRAGPGPCAPVSEPLSPHRVDVLDGPSLIPLCKGAFVGGPRILADILFAPGSGRARAPPCDACGRREDSASRVRPVRRVHSALLRARPLRWGGRYEICHLLVVMNVRSPRESERGGDLRRFFRLKKVRHRPDAGSGRRRAQRSQRLRRIGSGTAGSSPAGLSRIAGLRLDDERRLIVVRGIGPRTNVYDRV